MSVPQQKLPAQISQLAQQGIAIDARFTSASGGVLTNVDDFFRASLPDRPKNIRNFHQFTRGVFSSSGGGWQRDCTPALNGGGSKTLDFGVYIDALGNQFLMVQVGNTLYNYVPSATPAATTGSGAGTAITGMTALNATALPCIRPASPTTTTSNPFTVYCNGKQEPVKLFNTAAGSAPNTASTLGFNNGFYTETFTIAGGPFNAADKLSITATNNPTNAVLPLILSPHTVTYTVVAGDTALTAAVGLAALINADATAASAGVTATAANGVITVSFPIQYSGLITWSAASTGAETITPAAGPTNPTWPGVFNGLTYTKPALCSPFLGRMAFAAFANTGASGNAVGNVLLISSLGDAERFAQSTPARATDAWSIPIPPVLGAPTALFNFRPLTNVASEVLIVGCQNGMALVRGTDASNFVLEIQSTQFGVPSNRAFVQIDNLVLFMATDGFRQYNGDNNITTLITETLSLDFYDEFLKIDKTKWAVSHAVHHRDTQEVWFWVPYGSTYADAGNPGHAFIMNYNTLGGKPIWYFKDNTLCNASIEFNHQFYGGGNTGLIQLWYNGASQYDDAQSTVGAAQNIIPGAEIVLAPVGVGNPAQFCSINNVLIGAAKGNQKFLINAATWELRDDGSSAKTQQQPYNYPLQTSVLPQTVLGTVPPPEWTLGLSAFPQDESSFISGYVPRGHGRLWEFSLSCNDSSHNLDFTFLQATISLGGQRV